MLGSVLSCQMGSDLLHLCFRVQLRGQGLPRGMRFSPQIRVGQKPAPHKDIRFLCDTSTSILSAKASDKAMPTVNLGEKYVF